MLVFVFFLTADDPPLVGRKGAFFAAGVIVAEAGFLGAGPAIARCAVEAVEEKGDAMRVEDGDLD